jgi:hypothetical protein
MPQLDRGERPLTKERLKTIIRRRDVLGFAFVGAAAAAATTVIPDSATAKPDMPDLPYIKDKRKPRYHADSWEVQDFYRVNRYPAR